MVRRGLLVAVAVAGAVTALSLLQAPDDDRPVAVVGHTGVSLATTTPALPPVTTTTTIVRQVVVANRSSTVVQSDAGKVIVVNSGEAVASTGGNTVVGAPDSASPGSASIVNGPVTAVGNSSEVRITRP